MPGITIEEFSELTKFIAKNHGFRSHNKNGRMIKYVRCSFDTRTNNIYSVILDDIHFSIINQNRKRNLKKWVYAYLNREDDGFDPIRDDPEMNWGELIPKLKKIKEFKL